MVIVETKANIHDTSKRCRRRSALDSRLNFIDDPEDGAFKVTGTLVPISIADEMGNSLPVDDAEAVVSTTGTLELLRMLFPIATAF